MAICIIQFSFKFMKSHVRKQHVALKTTLVRAPLAKFVIVAAATIVLLDPTTVLEIKVSILTHAQTTNNVTQLDVSQEPIKNLILLLNRCVVRELLMVSVF